MTIPDLTGKRILLLGAETDLAAEIVRALAEAGASLALIAASNDPQTAFAVQRLARKLGASVSQAIDATNEMAVRVMVRQVSKELGGLDSVVFCGPDDMQIRGLAFRFGQKELDRFGRGLLVDAEGRTVQEALGELLQALAAPPASD
ncbi:MAG TPA: SDR family oxidoreductase [Dehalococcoidia bacterium]|nr:SDR family oxidoreductase [Dehalococcoidia bacterium]